MKILYHHRIASKDGQYVHVEELTKALKNAGHELIIIGPRVAQQSEFGSEGGFVSFLKRHIPGAIYEILEFCYGMLAFLKLSHAVIKYRPDGLYERYNLFLITGVWVKKLFNLPMLLEVNAPLFDERSKYGTGIRLKRFAKWTENYVWRNADYILPVTKVLRDMIQAQVPIPDESIVVIPNGIDPEKFTSVPTIEEAKKTLGLEGQYILGFTGFLREWHRLDLVLDVMKKLQCDEKKIHLLIVGDGPARIPLEKKAKTLGISDCVTFTGIVMRDRVASYVASFDIALQPDVVEYASPLKLFEYLALGKTIIAPPKKNIMEILNDGVNGILMSFDSPELPGCIERLRQQPSLKEEYYHAALQTILGKELTWEKNAEVVSRLFSQLEK